MRGHDDDDPQDDPAQAGPDSIRAAYERHGAQGYYAQFGAQYRNPHEPIVHELVCWAARLALGEPPPPQASSPRILDLACGSGESTWALTQRLGWPAACVEAADPFTQQAYLARHGRSPHAWSFEDVALGAAQGRDYGAVVCSFALHLCEPSWLPRLCWALASCADWLLVITPHKRPTLQPAWGFALVQERHHERVRARCYRSTLRGSSCASSVT